MKTHSKVQNQPHLIIKSVFGPFYGSQTQDRAPTPIRVPKRH